MKYQLAHPRFIMIVAVILALSGVVLVAAGIASIGGYTTESWVLFLSGILCVLFGASRAFYLWEFLAAQRKNRHEKRA